MGASSSSISELKKNEYLRRLASKDVISSNDPFWNQLLSFSFRPPQNSADDCLLEENIQELCQSLVVNNLETGNIGALIRVFLLHATELRASAQCENDIFTWQTYNALFILRCVCKYFIRTLKEEEVIRHFHAKAPPMDGERQEDTTVILDRFLNSLSEILVDLPLLDITYNIHLEAVNTMLVLLSCQMFTQKPASKLSIFRCIFQGSCAIHSCLVVKALVKHVMDQKPLPASHEIYGGGGSIILGLASGLWSALTFGYGTTSTSAPDDSSCTTPLANQSLLLIHILASHGTNSKNLHNPYRQALFHCSNFQDPMDAYPIQAAETFRLDFCRLYQTLCQTPTTDQTTLLLYLLLHKNAQFRTFVLSRSDIENLVVPIMKVLYNAPESNSHHIYMSLIILLILSEDNLFNASIYDTMLSDIQWYTERSITRISLGGLLILVIIRTIQYNMTKMRDKYLHTNCLAALANMSGQFRSLHPYVSQRLVSLFEMLSKKHRRLIEQVRHGPHQDADDPIGELHDLSVLEEVLRMVLEIINSCLSSRLSQNPNLIYTLLYKRDIFQNFKTHPSFQDVTQNIDTVLTYFSNRLTVCQTDMSVSEVLAVIGEGALQFPLERLKKFPELKFKYVEEEEPEDFFIPYVWSLVFHSSGFYWQPSTVCIFRTEKDDH